MKVNAAIGQCWVNVKFWGGVIPGKIKETDDFFIANSLGNTPSLKEMVVLGVPGFKCFLIHSGVFFFWFAKTGYTQVQGYE